MQALAALAIALVSSQTDACHTMNGSDAHPPPAVLTKAGIGDNPSAPLHGNGTIWTYTWPDGTVTFRKNGPGLVGRDGSLAMKFFWLMATDGPLTVTGRRLDGAAPPLRTEMAGGFVGAGYQPSDLIFPTQGCWEITARANGSEFTFVTKVIKTY